MTNIPRTIHHYYDASTGPFCNLTDLPIKKAEAVQAKLRLNGALFAAQRHEDYLEIRYRLEAKARRLFCDKGGKPDRLNPNYCTLGACPWLLSWFPEPLEVTIELSSIDPLKISFTYGDLFPAMRFPDTATHSGQIFTLAELPDLVQTHGLPQVANPEGKNGPKRYIEAQIWTDTPPT